METKKVLFISQHNPFGATGGGTLASKAYLFSFTKIAQGKIDILSCTEDTGPDRALYQEYQLINVPERSHLQKLTSIFSGYMNRYIAFARKWLIKHHDEYSLIVFDHSGIGGPLVKMAKSFGLKTVTIHHNYEREYFYDNNKGIYRTLFLNHVVRWERKSYIFSDLNLFLTNDDMETFYNVYGSSSGICRVLGTFEPKETQLPKVQTKASCETLTLAITGSLQSYQTEDAINYFFKELYSCIPCEFEIIIAGRNPSNKIIDLCKMYNNVDLVPNPDDMNSVISNADIYVCATRIGGGLKLRVMDGLRNGKPVLTHNCSARGFDVFNNYPFFKAFSTKSEFEKGLKQLALSIQNAEWTPFIIQEVYEKHFSYQAGLTRLTKYLHELNYINQ